jgi:dephospho-CoA kinase
LDYRKASNQELADFMAKALPNYDRDHVYPSDMKKLVQWYNILIENGVTDFEENNEAVESQEA